MHAGIHASPAAKGVDAFKASAPATAAIVKPTVRDTTAMSAVPVINPSVFDVEANDWCEPFPLNRVDVSLLSVSFCHYSMPAQS